jgi:hypothetical protein
VPASYEPDVSLPVRPGSNRRIAGIILVIMLGMAVLGLTFALGTWEQRESRHPRPGPPINGAERYVPAELPALGYLPVDTNVVAGIHVAEILRDKLAGKLLEPPLAAPLAQALAVVEQRTGLKLDAIDHVVFGTTLKDEVPQLTVVVQTRLPYSGDELSRIYPQKPIPQHKQPMFRIKLEPTGGGYVWCADPRTLVVILRPDAAKIEDMDRIPATPRKGDEGLPEPLREVLEKRLRGSVLWVAGDLTDSRFFDSLAAFTRFPAKQLELVKSIRRFGVGMLQQEDLTVMGAAETRDDKTVRAWKNYLESFRWEGIKSQKVIEPPAQGPDRHWVNLQIRADAGGIREILDGIYPRPK